MLGLFLLPFRHLTLDHSRIDPVAPHLTIRAFPCNSHNNPRYHCSNASAVELYIPATGTEDLKAPQERQPIRVQLDRLRGFEHQRLGHEMTEGERIDLLDHTRWGPLRRCAGLVVRRGSWWVFGSS